MSELFGLPFVSQPHLEGKNAVYEKFMWVLLLSLIGWLREGVMVLLSQVWAHNKSISLTPVNTPAIKIQQQARFKSNG